MKPYRSIKDIAATVRASLKEELPEWKFSVVVNHHSAITVSLMAGPEPVVLGYRDYSPSGSIDHFYTEAKPFPGYAQLNHYQLLSDTADRLTNGYYLTALGWAVLRRATQILSKEHWDKSDLQTDYFNCSFYRNVHIGKWNQDYQVRRAK